MLDANPDNFSTMGIDEWYPIHTYSSSYYQICGDALVDGRLFIRGYYGPVCYDLRKNQGDLATYSPRAGSRGSRGREPRSVPHTATGAKGSRLVVVFDIRGRMHRQRVTGDRGTPQGTSTGVYFTIHGTNGRHAVDRTLLVR
jgi:hypothetical protein